MNPHASASADTRLQRLEEWMHTYGTDVVNMAYAYVRNYHQAQDIAQDVFLRAYTKMDTFRGEASAKTWLLSITSNRCRDYLRSWSHRHEIQDTGPIDRSVTPDTPESLVLGRLQRDELWAALHQLPEKYREVITLYYINDLSGKDIADVLNTTEQNVRTRLHRGRTLLRELLEKGGDAGAETR